MKKFLVFLLGTALWTGAVSGGQPVHPDSAFLQSYSIKFDRLRVHDPSTIVLKKIACDRNGAIQVLSSEGLLRPFGGALLCPGELAPDRTYRPLLDRKVGALALCMQQFVYADDRAVFSNAWAGKLYSPHNLSAVSALAVGPDFSFLLTDGHTLQLRKDSTLLWDRHSGPRILDIRQHAGVFWILSETSISILSLADKKWKTVYTGKDLTCFEPAGETLLVGTHDGYFTLEGQTGRVIGDVQRRLPCTDITVIRRLDGVTWFGSAQGAFQLRGDGKFDYFASRRWLPSDRVTDIAAGPGGEVLVLTDKGLGEIRRDAMTLNDKALYFERQVRDRHIRYGFNATLARMTDGDLSTGSVEDSDNDGLWTSMYLGAEAFRYAATHSPEALDNCRESLDAMERLFTVNSLRGFPSRSFDRRGYESADTLVWRRSSSPEWDWKSTTSSDEAIGHVFAYGVVAELIDDTAIRNKAVRLLDALMSHIVEHDLYLIDWNGKPTTWGRWNPDYVNARPKMVGDRKINSSNIIAMLQTAYRFTGRAVYRDKAFELMGKYDYLENLLRPMSSIAPAPPDADPLSRNLSEHWNHSDDEMYFLGYWGLYRYAFDDSLRTQFKAAILDHWQAERPEKEGAWDIVTALTGVQDFDLDAAVWYLQRYPLDLIEWDVRNSDRKDIVFLPENFRRQTITEVLPPDELPVSRHNANRFDLDSRGGGHAEMSAGDIWLLPYWMGRWLGVIGGPMAAGRLPVGPQHMNPVQLPVAKNKRVIIAHRGDHTRAPENTLSAIRDAIACGVDYVEIDLRTTKDGQLVLSHDATVTRMTGAPGKVADLTLAQIKQLKVRDTDHIPEFKDVLQLCKGKMNIYLDFKEADVAQTWGQICAAGMEKQIVVYLNKPQQYAQWRRIAPAMPLMTSLPDEIHGVEAAGSWLEQHQIQVLDNVYDPALQNFVRQKGVALWLDVQSATEGPAVWSVLLSKGVDGVQTDHPEALMDWLRKDD